MVTSDATDWVGTGDARGGVERCLAAIDKLNPGLNAFEHVFRDAARLRADELDAVPAPQRGPLHGLPVAIKAENHIAGVVTSYGTKAHSTPAVESSTVVRRLEDAGAIIIGTTRMPEFGAWAMTESELGGITRHPHDPQYSPGGSSGGSAAAVAAGMVPVAIGGDGGGSIRIPAACCGLFGLKTQRGRVSVAPDAHLWGELGVVGPLTRSARDLRLLYQVIADEYWEPNNLNPGDLRVGVSVRTGLVGVRAVPVHQRVAREVASFLATGRAHKVKLPVPTSSFIPQYFQAIAEEAQGCEHPNMLEKRTRRIAFVGKRLPTWVRRRAATAAKKQTAQVAQLFQNVDVVVTPVMAARVPLAGQLAGAGMLSAQRMCTPYAAFTTLWNVTGMPAIAVPVGTGADGLPMSVQVAAGPGREALLIDCAEALHQEFAARQWPEK